MFHCQHKQQLETALAHCKKKVFPFYEPFSAAIFYFLNYIAIHACLQTGYNNLAMIAAPLTTG